MPATAVAAGRLLLWQWPGGAGLDKPGTEVATSQVLNNTTHGVIRFAPHAGSYDWSFVNDGESTFTDSGTGSCHGPLDATPPATAVTVNGQAPSAGWYSAPVTVTPAATDTGGSGVRATAYTTDGSDPKTSPTAKGLYRAIRAVPDDNRAVLLIRRRGQSGNHQISAGPGRRSRADGLNHLARGGVELHARHQGDGHRHRHGPGHRLRGAFRAHQRGLLPRRDQEPGHGHHQPVRTHLEHFERRARDARAYRRCHRCRR